jgi:mxaJ protein
MSSGAKQTVLSVSVVAASIVFLAWVALSGRGEPATPMPGAAAPQAERVDAPTADPPALRVCADPNNLPLSDRAGAGFENELAALAARELHRRLEYYWQPQRRGFVRTTLNAGKCDVIMGIPAASDMVRTTHPYYRSTYVFVSKRGLRPRISSFDDPRLRRLRIGIPMTGDDGGNPPPAMALARRHIFDNVRGYPVYGDYSKPRPSWGVLNGLRDGEIDVAVAWGPLAGSFAREAGGAFTLVPVDTRHEGVLPFAFDMSMGVRRGDPALAAALDAVIRHRGPEIRRLLERYGVPLVPVREGDRAIARTGSSSPSAGRRREQPGE